jgi:hypothetical protein
MKPRILGYVMARNEWPVLGLAITHALLEHVDHVLVLDHASTDGTREGLRQLLLRWPARVSVLRLDDGQFFQEATTALMMHVAFAATYDWVYVFDADEFLLTPTGRGLADVLADVAPEVDSVRYDIHQWVAPADMDETSLDHFERITQRALPNIFVDSAGELLADDIEHGDINFFDAPFSSKVVVRGHHGHTVLAGAHGLRLERDAIEMHLSPKIIRGAHLPLLSRGRLSMKCNQGQVLIAQGFPPDHGWHNQMLRRIQLNGRLDDFWANHSVPSAWATPSGATPRTVEDLSLTVTIGQAIHHFARFGPGGLAPTSPTQDQYDRIPIGPVVEAIRCVQAQRDDAVAQRDDAVAQRDDAVAALGANERSRKWRAAAWYRRFRPKYGAGH